MMYLNLLEQFHIHKIAHCLWFEVFKNSFLYK
jgi:hypothetical protein